MLSRFSARAIELFQAKGLPRKLEVKAATADAPAEVMIYDAIGDDGWGGGVSASSVVDALAKAGDGPVTVRINSPGGSAFDGVAIYNALKQRGGVTCRVDGIAASAASIIAMGGDQLEMPEASMLMIHRAWTIAAGNEGDFSQVAASLAKLDGVMAGIYASKSGQPAADMGALMEAETYLTADEAKVAGLCDTVVAEKKNNRTKAEAAALQAAIEPPAVVEPQDTGPVAADARAVEIRQRKLRVTLAE